MELNNVNILSATYTNALTNLLYAVFLFFYLVVALKHYLKKDHTFTLLLTLFFFTLLFVDLLGAYAHAFYKVDTISSVWIAISLIIILLNYFVFHAMKMPEILRVIIMVLSVLFVFLFLTSNNNFLYIAILTAIVYLFAACYSNGLLRSGFILVSASNIFLLVTRSIMNLILGYELPVKYRYDNDVYHILLIIATFMIYKAITKGKWPYSEIIE